MTVAQSEHLYDPRSVHRVPVWASAARAEDLEEVAFRSGAVLAALHAVLAHETVPHALLRERLALQAAEMCIAFSRRPERTGELRDALHLLRPGDQPGPAGEIYLCWRRAVTRPVTNEALQRALPAYQPHLIADWLADTKGAPIAQAAELLEVVLAEDPRAEAAALILADAVLARALGWPYLVPLLGVGLKPVDLRKRGEDLRQASYRAVSKSAADAVRLAADLQRKTSRLIDVAPKLRAKGAGEAVRMFLTQDAVAPAALPLTDRAARRLCDRLVALGAVRELTGRDTFRLYGV